MAEAAVELDRVAGVEVERVANGTAKSDGEPSSELLAERTPGGSIGDGGRER